MTSLTDQPLVQDARRYLAVLHKRRGLLLTAVGLSLVVAVLHNYTTRPVYQATVQLLIDNGADVHINGGAPLLFAIGHKSMKLIECMIAAGATITREVLHAAAASDSAEVREWGRRMA